MGEPAWIADLLYALLGPPCGCFLPIGLIVAYRLLKDRPTGNCWGTMFRGVGIGVILFATFALFSSDAVLSLTGGWGGVAGLSIAGLFSWLIGLAGDPAIG